MPYVLIISMVLCLRNSLEPKAPIKGHPACIQAIVGPHNLPLIRPCRDVPSARFAGLTSQLDSCRRGNMPEACPYRRIVPDV